MAKLSSTDIYGDLYVDGIISGVLNGSVSNNLIVKLNSGTTEGTNQFTFNGSAAKTINITPSAIGAAASSHNHGLLHDSHAVAIENTTTDNGWSMINSSYNGYILKSIRTNANAPTWLCNNFAAGVAFGGADTKGVLSCAYNAPSIKFAGGNGSKPVWWVELTGTSGTSYDLNRINTAYTHSQAAHAPSNAQKNSDITKAEIEAKLTGAITTHTHSYLPLSGGTMTGKITTPNNSQGITIGDDATLCDRNIADHIVIEGSTATNGGITFGSGKDTNIYRGGANILKTDDTMNAVGGFQWNGQSLDSRYAASGHTHNHLEIKGNNTITSTTNDTTANWGAQKSSIHWYTTADQLTDQPSQWGYLLNVGQSSEVHQLWMTQASGDLKHRGGNSSGWSGTWKTLLDTSNFKTHVTPSAIGAAASSHTHTLFTRNSVGDIGWNTTSNQGLPVAVSAIAYWNGAYGGTASNLTYCNKGAFGTIVTKNSEDYATASHTHSYLPLSGGTMTGDLKFTDVTSTTYPAVSKKITWNGSTDGVDLYYQVDASDKGRLMLNTRDDSDCVIAFANQGTIKSTIDNSGNFSGNAASASGFKFWSGTQAQYDALSSKDSKTVYMITG